MRIVRIYCIEDCNGLKYIGSTNQPLKHRLGQHKDSNQCTSRELDLDNCKMYTLEETDEEHRKVKEQYWIDNTECENIQNTIFDKKEYDKQWEKSDKRKESKKEYYKQNKELYNSRYQKDKYKINQRKKDNRIFQWAWGGDPRFNNNLLKIDLDIFI
jgi:hypothetical protein